MDHVSWQRLLHPKILGVKIHFAILISFSGYNLVFIILNITLEIEMILS